MDCQDNNAKSLLQMQDQLQAAQVEVLFLLFAQHIPLMMHLQESVKFKKNEISYRS